jgi:hypothetical protein
MASERRVREYCPDCFEPARGFKKVFCTKCGGVRPTAGYGSRAERLRLQPEPEQPSRPKFFSIL